MEREVRLCMRPNDTAQEEGGIRNEMFFRISKGI